MTSVADGGRVPTIDDGRPVVHIGASKTGTSWLQSALFPSVVGRAYGGSTGENRLLNAAVLSLTDTEGFSADAVRNALRSGPPLLLSWEGLSCSNNPLLPSAPSIDVIVERLASVMPDCHVVMFTREPPAWRRSSYSTYLRGGGCLGFSDYCDLVEESGADDWNSIVDVYRRRFPSVTVVPYEAVSSDIEHGARRVFGGLGVQFGEVRAGRPNRSMEDWRLRMVRRLNQHSGAGWCESPKRRIKGAAILAAIIGRER